MPSYAEYFNKVTYKPKFFIGDRVFGKYQKIPFAGTVGNDFLADLDQGPRVIVFLDLPIKTKAGLLNMITVKPKDIKLLIDYSESANASAKTKNSKTKKQNSSSK